MDEITYLINRGEFEAREWVGEVKLMGFERLATDECIEECHNKAAVVR